MIIRYTLSLFLWPFASSICVTIELHAMFFGVQARVVNSLAFQWVQDRSKGNEVGVDENRDLPSVSLSLSLSLSLRYAISFI